MVRRATRAVPLVAKGLAQTDSLILPTGQQFTDQTRFPRPRWSDHRNVTPGSDVERHFLPDCVPGRDDGNMMERESHSGI
jgi:hypothetical protein